MVGENWKLHVVCPTGSTKFRLKCHVTTVTTVQDMLSRIPLESLWTVYVQLAVVTSWQVNIPATFNPSPSIFPPMSGYPPVPRPMQFLLT
ncbi:hypothetical protein CEXT_81931 [Caerostris extrusa]|uniref:Uncharacterized protein n=1 Tax=Caerostris extrusa TaxID=172846 RepID=A0AAV4NK35_CAEEX|nr:hypothetical protein CEXT_81931 [Caerostris extrusa]